MKWRCTWCGKPHAENDPPCDNCGHNKFERAIVREDERGEATEAAAPASSDATGTVDTGPTYVWTCPNCGRDHVRNNPPCSRCGNPDLEKTEQTYDDVERDLETPGWLEVARPYAPILLVFGLLVALFATGVVPTSIIPGVGAPSPPDAPGEGTEAAGVDLEATEMEVHERLENDREVSRSYDEGLAAYVEYANRASLAREYEGDDPDRVAPSDFDVDCDGEPLPMQVVVSQPIDEYDDEAALADDVAGVLRSSLDEGVTDPGSGSEALDIHVVDDSIYVAYAAC